MIHLDFTLKEYIDIWNEDGTPSGKSALKNEAHKKGWFHPTVHVWMYTHENKILLQQRGAHKETFPSFWDVSVAGHVMAGETILEAAIREVNEEIGIHILPTELIQVDIRKNVNIHSNGIKDCEFQHVFLCKLNTAIENLTIQKEEVDGIELLSLEKFKFYTENRNENFKLVPADYTYYEFIIDQVTQRL